MMAAARSELKSPCFPLFQRGNFLRRLQTPLWKRGEGEIFHGRRQELWVHTSQKVHKMRLPLICIATVFVFAALFVKADAFAQLTKLSVGYVGVTSDNAAAFIARETGIYARNGL